MKNLPDPPEHWGKDSLTDFYDNARMHSYATFDNYPQDFRMMMLVASHFEQCKKGLGNSPDHRDRLIGTLLLRSNGYFFTASHLCASGQIPEAFIMMRACLESALYGYAIATTVGGDDVWWNRHESDADKKKSKNTFSPVEIKKSILASNPALGTRINDYYQITIDFGGHPLPGSIAPYVSETFNDDGRSGQHSLTLMSDNQEILTYAMMYTSEIGITALQTFIEAQPARFALTGFPESMNILIDVFNEYKPDAQKRIDHFKAANPDATW